MKRRGLSLMQIGRRVRLGCRPSWWGLPGALRYLSVCSLMIYNSVSGRDHRDWEVAGRIVSYRATDLIVVLMRVNFEFHVLL